MNKKGYAKTFLIGFLVAMLLIGAVFATLEDFTTYTEVDTDNKITVTAPKCYANAIQRQHEGYVYYDYGVNYFNNNFTHYLTVNATDGNTNGVVGVWALWNAVDDWTGCAGGTGLLVFLFSGAGFYRIYLRQYTSGANTQNYSDYATFNSVKYLVIYRRNGMVGVQIYSSESDRFSRVNMDKVITVSQTFTNYRYIYGMQSLDAASGTEFITASCWNLELEPTVYTVTFFHTVGGVYDINGTYVANGTETAYLNNTVLKLVACVNGNNTYTFSNFTFDTGYNIANPYNWTTVFTPSNLTVWCYFEIVNATTIESGGAGEAIILFGIVGIPLFTVVALVVWRKAT